MQKYGVGILNWASVIVLGSILISSILRLEENVNVPVTRIYSDMISRCLWTCKKAVAFPLLEALSFGAKRVIAWRRSRVRANQTAKHVLFIPDSCVKSSSNRLKRMVDLRQPCFKKKISFYQCNTVSIV